MIIARTPFRISFAGGGSDLSAFYKKQPGCVLSASINKYMYIALHPYFDKNKTMAKYSKTELVDAISDINHPIIKQVFTDMNIKGIDITSMADIPAKAGLGSSSSFTVCLLHVLHAYLGNYVSKEELASKACEVEIEKLGEPIGKQDQYAAAYGGLNFITFNPDDSVNVEKIYADKKILDNLNKNLVLFYTNSQRKAGSILCEQKKNTETNDKKFNNLVKMTELARNLKESIYSGNLDDFGAILHEGWMLKKELAGSISNEMINKYYDLGLKNGALGGKLLGAGGGGFLLFYCKEEKQEQLIGALRDLEQYSFDIEYGGSQIIFYG